MIKTRVLTGWGLSRQCVCVCLWVCVTGDGEVCNHLSCGETASTVCAWKHFLSKLHADTHSHSADELFFLKDSSSSRGGTSLLAATYDPPPPIIHTHTQAHQPALCLPLYSKLDFFSSSLSLPSFSSPPFSAGCSFVPNLIPVSLPASASLSLLFLTSLSSFNYALSSSPPSSSSCSISFTPDHLFRSPFYLPSFFSILSLLKSSPRSVSLSLILCSLYSPPLSLCMLSSSFLLCDLSPSIFPLPFTFPFSLFAALFSFTLGVSALWKLSTQWDIQWKKGLKNKLRGRERREVKSSKGLKRRKG